MLTTPTNHYEALVLAMQLALDAPSEAQFVKARKMVEYFGTLVAPEDISLAKKQVLSGLTINEYLERNTTK